MPKCFFSLVANSNKRTGDTFEDFARLVLENKDNA